MLRGLTTLTHYADDVEAAGKWYTELLGMEPYFARAVDGRPAYLEFRIGDYQHELGIKDRRFAPHPASEQPVGVIPYWHVDDIEASYQKLLALGATEHAPPKEWGAGFVTASVIDPFGNVLGVMYNEHYLAMLAANGKA